MKRTLKSVWVLVMACLVVSVATLDCNGDDKRRRSAARDASSGQADADVTPGDYPSNKPSSEPDTGHPSRLKADADEIKGHSSPAGLSAWASLFPDDPKVWVYAPEGSHLMDRVVDSRQVRTFMSPQNGSIRSFKRTRLYRKLRVRFKELSRLVSSKAEFKDLDSLVGEETAFALYDIGELKFVFISKLSPQKFSSTMLWPAREKAEQHNLNSAVFYSLTSANKAAELLFGEADGMLIVSNRESLFREALGRVVSKDDKPGSLARDESFNKAFPQDFEVRDFLLYLDQDVLNKNPYFLRYWVYRNFDEVDWIKTAVVDLSLSGGKWDERRYYSADALPPGRESRELGPCLSMQYQGIAGDCGVISGAAEASSLLLSVISNSAKDSGEAKADYKQELEGILEPAGPLLFGSAIDVSWEEEALFWKNSYCLVIKLKKPSSLDLAKLRRTLASMLSEAVFIDKRRKLSWEKNEYGTSCSFPLFNVSGIWMDVRGDFLVICTDGVFHRKILKALGSGPQSSFTGIYKSRLDVKSGAEEIQRIYWKLDRYEHWSRPESQGTISYMLSLAGHTFAGEIRREISFEGGLVQEKLVATPIED